MAITRKYLKGMGLTDEQVESIIDAHSETVSGLKDQIDSYKSKAESLSDVQKELEEAKAELESGKQSGWKEKYEALKQEYEDYKTEQTEKATHTAKETAYRALLTEAGISDKRIPTIIKVSQDNINALELDSKGNVKGVDDLKKTIETDWSDFIPSKQEKGADTSNPPANTGGSSMSKDDIMSIKDPVKRQNAIAENLEVFTGKDE